LAASKSLQVTQSEAKELLHALSPYHYVRSLGFKPYEWQKAILKSPHKRKSINGARQSGKSTIVSAKPCHIAKYHLESVSLILAATEYQAFLDMEKVKDFIAHDPSYPEVKRSSDRLITLANGSWIMVVPATEKAARGPSAPRLILIDEASRVEDIVYRSGVIPMLTENPDCELINISTPNGKQGFFYKSFNNPKWERYEIRSPWEVIDLEFRLVPAAPEDEYRRKCAEKGIIGFDSPRHRNQQEQEFNLGEMGPLMYRQEYGPQFVEPEDQVFSYDDIERMMGSTAEPLDTEEIGEAEADLTL
jgi:hypothetical protein